MAKAPGRGGGGIGRTTVATRRRRCRLARLAGLRGRAAVPLTVRCPLHGRRGGNMRSGAFVPFRESVSPADWLASGTIEESSCQTGLSGRILHSDPAGPTPVGLSNKNLRRKKGV